MTKNSGEYSVKLTGPGVSFDRPISEEAANQIINLVMMGNALAGARSPDSFLPPSQPSSRVPLNQGQVTGLTIRQFIAQKRPANVYQRVACLAYHLTNSANTPHFKTKDISQANTDAASPRLSNAAAFVRDATSKYGYLSAAGKGSKQITVFGENIVEALPDQEKVKQLHAENKTHRRRKISRKKKSR